MSQDHVRWIWGRVFLSFLATLVITHVPGFIVYGTFAVMFGLEPPDTESPARFMLSVLVMKVGVALAFVLIYYVARASLSGRWLVYAGLWWLMSAVVEIGEAIGPGYTWEMALAGIISEAIYFPLSAWVVDRLIGVQGNVDSVSAI